ncbi:YARHG domain-containing protein [Bacillus sp. AFS002410]|uniref:YARHG domain-containing protein n=1 Tax=Bacillus sp. AFS002410 TaxID=2033481 RepID=UPI00211D3B90|nr:YARHG domain-containing protein [Bacillus sp. AFS002410]
MAYETENKVESRSEHRKVKNNEKKVDGNNRYFPLMFLIAGVLVIVATAIFYVYPKIMNEGNMHPNNEATRAVANKETKKVTKKEKKTETKSVDVAKKTASKKTNAAKDENKLKGYIIPDSNLRKLTNEDLSKLTSSELRLARNEIYARHGFVFQSSDLTIYFTSKSWYSPNPAYNGALSDVEKYNLNLIKSKE